MVYTSLKYSFLCVIVLISIYLVASLFGQNVFLDLKFLFSDMVILFLFSYLGAREYKLVHNNGKLLFWEGATIGFLLSLVASLFFVIFIFLLFETIPSFLSDYKDALKAFLETKENDYIEKFSKEDFDKQYTMVNEITTKDLILDIIGKKIVVGFFISPVVAVILKKKTNRYDE